MRGVDWAALATAATAFLTAAAAVLHSIVTRQQLLTHQSQGAPPHPATPPSTQVSVPNSHA